MTNPFKLAVNFIKQTYDEGRKSVWPTRQEVINGTMMVIGTVAVAVLIFAGFDWILQQGLMYILNR